MDVSHLEGDYRSPLDTSIDPDDQMAMATYVMNTLLNDRYASPLYPTGGVQTFQRDSQISAKFAKAVSVRASLFDLGFEVTVCTSTSSNACTSSSSTWTINI